MKMTIKKFLLMILAAGAVILTGCDIKSPVEGVKVIFNTAEVENVVAVDFRDAGDGRQISGTVTVQFGGEDEELVTNLVQEEIDSIKTKSGLMNFSLKEGTTPTQSNPVNINLVASASGYVSTSKPVSITSIGKKSYTVYMVSKTNAPNGASAKTQSGGTTNSSGAVTGGAVQYSTDPESNSGATSSIEISEGTVIRDKQGNPLQGALTSDMIYYNPLQPEAMTALPGGSYANVQGQGESYIATAGFVSIDIFDNSGREAESFSNGSVNITMDIPAGTTNPSTGEDIKQGDQIPVYSYDESTGTWKFESTTTVSSSRSGLLEAEVANVKHLSFYALLFLWNDFCTPGPTINVNGSFTSLTVVARSDMFGLQETYTLTPTNVPYALPTAPSGLEIDVVVIDNTTSNTVYEETISDLCANPTLTVNMPNNDNTIDVAVDIEAFCPDNEDVVIRPDDIPIYMKGSNGVYNYIGELDKGKITVPNLIDGETYDFGTYYEGDFYERTFTVDGPTFKPDPYELDEEYCEDI